MSDMNRYNDYKHFAPIQTRWMDNDVYGHVNNVVYYSYFDTAVNEYLINAGVLDIHDGAVIGLVVETSCSYSKPISFPDKLVAGVRVAKIGTSSVRYEIGLFLEGDDEPAATGYFIHVYVDSKSRKSVKIPDAFKQALMKIQKD